MTTINTNNSSTTAFVVTPDTTGTFVVNTGAGAGATAMTIDASQNVTFAGSVTSSAGVLISQSMTTLGTLTTTSGTTQTLSGLDLTPYKYVRVEVNDVNQNSGAGRTLCLGTTGVQVSQNQVTTGGNNLNGSVEITLSNGGFITYVGNQASGGTSGSAPVSGRSAVTSASTSLQFLWNGTGSFNSGTIKVYGVK